MDPDKNSDSEIEILRGILSEVQDLNAQLARTDERSRQNKDNVETLREDRIVPVERQSDTNTARSKRNSIILGAGVTFVTLLLGAALTYAFTLL